MKSLFTIRTFKTVGLAAIVPALLMATIATHYMTKPPAKANDAVIKSQPAASKKQDSHSNQSNASALQADTSTTATPTTTSTQATPTTTHQSATSSTQAPQTTNTSSYQQTPTPTPTCNESMKTSYTNLYNSQVTSENTSWSNQVSSWNNYASAHGMSFSGYTQSQINANKPAHDARLAQLQTQYYQNLASINCNP